MRKFIFALGLVTLSLFSTVHAAAITTALPSNTYITANGLDWTWAQGFAFNSGSSFQLYGPEFHDGWRYATSNELTYLYNNLLSSFQVNGVDVQSAAYWSDTTDHTHFGNLSAGYIASGINTILGQTVQFHFETIYVRGGVGEVPIPAALFMFAPALLGFMGLRRKAKNSVA